MKCPLVVLRAEGPLSLSRHCSVTAICSAELAKSKFGRLTQRHEQFRWSDLKPVSKLDEPAGLARNLHGSRRRGQVESDAQPSVQSQPCGDALGASVRILVQQSRSDERRVEEDSGIRGQ